MGFARMNRDVEARGGQFCILVASSDRARDIFEITFQNSDAMWRQCGWPRYAGFTSRHADLHGFVGLAANAPADWRGELGDQLDRLPDHIRYVLLLIEDFLITSPVDGRQLQAMADHVRDHDLAYVRLVPLTRNLFGRLVEAVRRMIDKRPLRVFRCSEPYYSAVEPAIWRRDYLRAKLRNPGTIWEFEREVGPEQHHAVWEPIVNYKPLVGRGMWYPEAPRLLAQQGYSLDGSTRPRQTAAPMLRRLRERIVFNLLGYLSFRLRRRFNMLPRR